MTARPRRRKALAGDLASFERQEFSMVTAAAAGDGGSGGETEEKAVGYLQKNLPKSFPQQPHRTPPPLPASIETRLMVELFRTLRGRSEAEATAAAHKASVSTTARTALATASLGKGQ